ncbi:phosphoglucomutase [Clostridia bacterium]|nr:phosphoglucomutase [Clostridia bacterium]
MDTKKINELYTLWREKAVADRDLVTELESVNGKDDEILDRFYRDLEFGTAGLRGVIGAGTNRMNYYTVRQATQGLANYILSYKPTGASVAIAYDSRIKSDYFSLISAEVLVANGIAVHMYDRLMPTPMLSYAVRACKCDAGINVTASHNPAKYNGYKVYGPDGCQLTLEAAEAVLKEIEHINIFTGVKSANFDEAVKSGKIQYISEEIQNDFYAEVKKQCIHPEIAASSGLKIVYTPLNGTGNKPVQRILRDIGITDVTVVPEQENPDGNFPTCPFPNPEIREALATGLALSDKVKPDLLLATDPDCDRVGIAAPDGNGGYALFSGNEVGAMLLEYVCRERTARGTLPENAVAVKSIVSTTLADKIAEKYGVKLVKVLTGFKFIGEQIGELEKKGEEKRFIFGFEESYGYLAGTYCRDKDAVIGSMLIAEMAAFYKSQGVSLVAARERLYKEYGYYLNKLDNFGFEGASGMAKMAEQMAMLRKDYPKTFNGAKVVSLTDYQESLELNLETGAKTTLTLPKSDVVVLTFENGGSIVVRPSGTEPKIKVYYTAIGKTLPEAFDLAAKYSKEFTAFFIK